MKSRVLPFGIIAIPIAAVLFSLLARPSGPEFQVTPLPASAAPELPARSAGTEVGTGSGLANDPQEAVREALAAALRDLARKTPDFAILYVTSGSDTKRVLHAARLALGPNTKIFGGNSDSRGVMTDRGYVAVSRRGYEAAEEATGVALMTVSSQDITWGVSSAQLSDFSSPQQMAQAVVLDAVKSAGKAPEDLPRVILLSSTIGIEEEVLEGIEQAVGKTVPVLGGTVGGPVMGVLGTDDVYDRGICLAVLYTDLPFGWTFEAGFDVAGQHAGIATKVEGQAIVEIDHKPALDVYNQWVDGEIDHLREQGAKPGAIRDLLTLHPLYRRYKAPTGRDYLLFSHPWPKDDRMQDKSVMTSTKIQPGEEICLSSGTWETLLNRVGNLPSNAKANGRIRVGTRPILAIGFICGGILGVIPETERDKMSFLINYANGNGPFIATFTWGEQGHFPGIGNKHGNLLTSFLVIAPGGADQ
jgi:hypothetical protein